MSLRNQRNRREAGEQDFELNLAPIIDGLVVLIAFVLISTSFVSIGIMDAGVAAAGVSAKPGEPAPVRLTLELLQPGTDAKVRVRLTGRESLEQEVGLEQMNASLADIRRRWPQLQSATLVAGNAVPYRDVVHAMDLARRSVPAVLLGGF